MPKLVISELTFDVQKIADALMLGPDQVTLAMSDGRGAWPFSEHWGTRLYEFIKHGNSNKPGSDGAVALKQLGDMNVSVRALARSGVKFQQAKFVGVGRKGTQDDLIASIEHCDRVVVVDITEFPVVRFLPLDTPRLVGAAHRGLLTTKGWTKDQFYKWVHQTYETSILPLTL